MARVDAQLSQTRDLKRAEDTLDQLAFAALAFQSSGLITWLTATAINTLYTCIADIKGEEADIRCGDYLPRQIWEQTKPALKECIASIENCKNDIQLGSNYIGKIIPCQQIDEYMLLIQKDPQEWDLASLKTSFGLTAREAEILMWISRGKTNKEVGLILNTSPRKVNKHQEHIF